MDIGEEDLVGFHRLGGVGMVDLLVGGGFRLREEVGLEVDIVEGMADLLGMEAEEVILIDQGVGVGVLIEGGVGVPTEGGDEGVLVIVVMIVGVLRPEGGVGAEVSVGAGVHLEGGTEV